MQIHGFLKTTLLDYPRHVASTIFTGSCNFHCPFCHNGDLVLHPNRVPLISEEEIFTYLKKRKGILEGVCISGGEPTLQADLRDFILKIKELGYLVKLDTNGYRPDVLSSLLQEHLLDYVAMDIKNSPGKYELTCACPGLDLSLIERSTDLLMNGSIPFEFRTTIVRQLHVIEDMDEIGRWLKDAPAYYLQNYTESDNVISPGFTPCSIEELKQFQERAARYIPSTLLRGVSV
ncbi:MAG: anaerobic ribonucleoside-triphosphate reductase activating protein [Lachnospiraceae bacterium]